MGSSHQNMIEGNMVTRCEHVAFPSSFSKDNIYHSFDIWRNNRAFSNHTHCTRGQGSAGDFSPRLGSRATDAGVPPDDRRQHRA
jgi:hypothetical protein